MSLYKKYLLSIAVIFFVVYIGLVSFQYSLVARGIMPATPISNSFSFNEKSAFLARSNLQSCEVIASGSSMTLYNLNSQIISNYFSDLSYMNISSWGITLGDNLKILKVIISNICKPKVVIIVSSPSDFRELEVLRDGLSEEKFINAVKGEGKFLPFLSVKNIHYVMTHYKKTERVKTELAGHASLIFDADGGVSIVENDWSIKSPNWHTNMIDLVRATSGGYQAFEEVVTYLNDSGIRVIHVQTPIREDMYEQSAVVIAVHTEKMKSLADSLPFESYDLSIFPAISKQQYSDLFHLTGSGADLFTVELVRRMAERK